MILEVNSLHQIMITIGKAEIINWQYYKDLPSHGTRSAGSILTGRLVITDWTISDFPFRKLLNIL